MLRRKFWIGICVFLFLVAVILFWCYRSVTLGPQFYRDAATVDRQTNSRLGEELENEFLNAHNSMVREDQWSIAISDEQLNGWIAAHLAKKYSRFYPDKIENLCTSFHGNKIHIAFKVKNSFVPFVVSIRVDAFVTSDEQNIGLKLEKIGTGMIPFPKKGATQRITKALEKSETQILWTTEQGHPVGLLPVDYKLANKIGRKLAIKSISIEGRRLFVSGTASDIVE